MKLTDIKQLNEGIFDFLKKKLVKKSDVDLTPIDKEQRDFVSSVFPHTNANLKWDSKDDSKYVMPYNIHGTYGRGKFSFYVNHGQLFAGVALHGSASDAGNPRIVPLAHYEVAIKSKADLEKLKADLE